MCSCVRGLCKTPRFNTIQEDATRHKTHLFCLDFDFETGMQSRCRSFKFLLCECHEGETEIVSAVAVQKRSWTRTRLEAAPTKVDAGPLAPTKRQRPRHRRLLREHVTVALDVVHGGIGGSAQRSCARLYLASACRIQGSAHGDARSANCH